MPTVLAVALLSFNNEGTPAVPAASATPAATQAVSPAATPTPAPRLQLDVDRHVERLLNPGVPRFEVEVTVRTPQEALREHFRGFQVCGGGGPSAPTVAEMAPHRPQGPTAVSVDILKLISDLQKSGPDRFFVYRVTKAEGVSYLVREGRLPWSQLTAPGATLEPIAAFPDRASATQAWRRLERGYPSPLVPRSDPCGSPGRKDK